MEHERDQTWAAIYTVAERMNQRYRRESGLTVVAKRHRTLNWVVEGIYVGDANADVFEPVRRRRHFSDNWIELQRVQDAASAVSAFIRERPDQSGL